MAAGARMRLYLKQQVDLALVGNGVVQNVLVVRRTGQQIAMEPGRDRWWHELQADVSADCPAEWTVKICCSSSTPPNHRQA